MGYWKSTHPPSAVKASRKQKLKAAVGRVIATSRLAETKELSPLNREQEQASAPNLPEVQS